MELYDAISKRKSVRKYKDEPLSNEQLNGIMAFSKAAKPLFPEIKTEMRLLGADDVSIQMFAVKAPHYLAFFSEEKEGRYLNAGFMLQQTDLFLSASGLGSCWLGLSRAKKEKKPGKGLNYIIMLALGTPDEEPQRTDISQFRRRTLSEISGGNDPRLEAARLAPSAKNSQPWYYICEDGRIYSYREKINPAMELIMGSLNTIDMGIALCHIWLAGEKAGLPFSFTTEVPRPAPKGYLPIGTIK